MCVHVCICVYVCESMPALEAKLFVIHLVLFSRLMAVRSVGAKHKACGFGFVPSSVVMPFNLCTFVLTLLLALDVAILSFFGVGCLGHTQEFKKIYVFM